MSEYHSETVGAVTAALRLAKRNFGPLLKDASNTFFDSKYATLKAVLQATEAHLDAADLVLLQHMETSDSGAMLVTSIVHSSGEWLASRHIIKPVKQDPQAEGSAITYARRYGIVTMLGLAAEDDDGNSASKAPDVPARTSGRDWAAEAARATTVDEVLNLGRECNALQEFTGAAKAVLMKRRTELTPQETGVPERVIVEDPPE